MPGNNLRGQEEGVPLYNFELDDRKTQTRPVSLPLSPLASRSYYRATSIVLFILALFVSSVLFLVLWLFFNRSNYSFLPSSEKPWHYTGESNDKNSGANRSDAGCNTKICKVKQEMSSLMDHSMQPCDDFYEYACGRFDTAETKYKTQLERLNGLNSNKLLKILESGKPSDPSLEAEAKAQKMYESCRDELQRDIFSQNWGSVKSLLKNATGFEVFLQNYNGGLGKRHFETSLRNLNNVFGFTTLFHWSVKMDSLNPNRHSIQLAPSAFGVPDRSVFIKQDSDSRASRKSYLDAMLLLATRLSLNSSAKQYSPGKIKKVMLDVLELETKIANISEIRGPYSRVSLKYLGSLVKLISWPDYFKGLVNDDGMNIEVINTEFFGGLSDLIRNLLDTAKGRVTLHNYLVWQTLKRLFHTYIWMKIHEQNRVQKAPNNAKWICFEITKHAFDLALTSLYIRKDYKDTVESKLEAQRMVNLIKQAEIKRFQTDIFWMDQSTRDRAVKRAQDRNLLVGYPDIVLQEKQLSEHYSMLDIDPKDFWGNYIGVFRYQRITQVGKLNQPVDRNKWSSSALHANAYHYYAENKIEIPLALLQPPFFHPSFPKGINYGHIGSIMGHELLHGLLATNYRKFYSSTNATKRAQPLIESLDLDIQSDIDFTSTEWWSDSTKRMFANHSKCIIKQYSNLGDLKGFPTNGRETFKENIADIGGLQAAFEAYRNEISLEPTLNPGSQNPLTNAELSLLAPEQIFFLSFAQNWCESKSTWNSFHESILERHNKSLSNDDEEEEDSSEDQYHGPRKIRVLGTIINMKEEFAKAWNCRSGDFMNDQSKCSIY